MITAFALLLAGCAPNDAVVTGNWYVWLAANNSGTVDEGKIDVRADAKRIYDCSGRGWDSETENWEDGYVGPTQNDDASSDKFFGGACAPDDSGCPADQLATQCGYVDNMEFYDFLQLDGFYLLTEPIDAWRSEALINGEGDFQLTVHNKLSDGEDMRFAFVVKPEFAPLACEDTNGDGTAEVVNIDGMSWVDAWSQDLDGDKIYYLNAGAQQSEPGVTDEYDDPVVWYFPTEWSAGFAQSKFAGEEFASRPSQYGLYDEVGTGQHFELSSTSDDDGYWGSVIDRADPDMDAYAATADDLRTLADGWAAEIDGIAINGIDPAQADLSSFGHKVEDNTWRPVDLTVAGIDGWMQVDASWVKFKPGTNLVEGGSAEGEFQIYFEGFESASVMMVTGTFKVDKIRKDKWAYPLLASDKRDENGTPFCGDASSTQ
ncbi:MAG: hypothetical protein GXP62_11470 [Oligoflexia bacterium]|nr:hypothetical protein [Oligoflexia bacterium]